MLNLKRYGNIILDINNLYWRVISTCKAKNQNNFNLLIGIESFLDRLNTLYCQMSLENGKFWLLFDNPDSMIRLRKDIDPEYKSHRDMMDEEMKSGLQYVSEILKVYNDNYRIIFGDKLEADDIVYPLLNYIKDKNRGILLISADMDWARCIDDNVFWYNYKQIFTRETFKTKYNFYPDGNSVQIYKSFTGDTSDNIKNPFYCKEKNINWKFSRELLHNVIINCKDIDDFYKKLNNNQLGLSEKWIERFNIIEQRIRLNYRLVDFLLPDDIDIESMITKSVYSKNKLKLLFDVIGLKYEPRMIDEENPEEFLTWAKYDRI